MCSEYTIEMRTRVHEFHAILSSTKIKVLFLRIRNDIIHEIKPSATLPGPA